VVKPWASTLHHIASKITPRGEAMTTEYRYEHFKRELLIEDMAFAGGPGPGDPMPEFDLPTTDGGRVRKSDFVGDRPLFLTFASIT
jgi:hypothetical protein